MIILGLTGSIGMGKSTVAAMLEALHIPVHEADATVHALLRRDGKAIPLVASGFPIYKYPEIYDKKTKEIKREALGKVVFGDPQKRKKLEKILHPLVREDQDEFIRKHTKFKTSMIALDIPLLFETGSQKNVDFTLVVSAPDEVQRTRVLDRPGMTEEKFRAIVDSQISNNEKCERADYIIPTGLNRAETLKTLKSVLREIKK